MPEDRVATPAPHTNRASFVFHGSGSHRSIRKRNPTTMDRGMSASSVVFTRAMTPVASGLRKKMIRPIRPRIPREVRTTSSHGNECMGFGGCHTGAASSGAGALIPLSSPTVAALIFFRR